VVRLDGYWVEDDTARAFGAMRDAARRDGVELCITSGFRTQAEQEKLYRCWRRGRCPLAARPGHSKHQSGLALDLDVRTSRGAGAWLARHAGQFGFKRTVKPEPWHWERDEP
jgi:D-alanyl-D-alanine carboxypeptidase